MRAAEGTGGQLGGWQSWELELQKLVSGVLPSPHEFLIPGWHHRLLPRTPHRGARQRWVCTRGHTKLGVSGYQVRSPRSSWPLLARARGWRKGSDSSNSEGEERLFAVATGGLLSSVPAHSASGNVGFPGRAGVSSYPAPSDFTWAARTSLGPTGGSPFLLQPKETSPAPVSPLPAPL